MPSKAGSRLVIWLTGTALVILLATVVLSYEDWTIYRTATEQARYARSVLDATDAVAASLQDAETGMRGFLLTGDAKYLEPYRRGVDEIPAKLKQLTKLLSGDPSATN